MTYNQKRRENLFPFITFRHKIKEKNDGVCVAKSFVKSKAQSNLLCRRRSNFLILTVVASRKERENRKSFVEIEKSVQ
jgi:hypothetical protein